LRKEYHAKEQKANKIKKRLLNKQTNR